MTLQGQIKPISLQGSINVVPNEGGAGGPLQSKTVYPSHDEQIIMPDEDFYGLAVVKVEPVPRVPACFAETSHQLPNVVETRVNIGAEVSVTEGKYYTHFLYNGVRLPRIPDSMLGSYPYAWIRNDGANGNYNLVFGKQPWYFNSQPSLVCGDKASLPYYSIPISSYSTATEWTNRKDAVGTNFGIASNRTVLWSNHDIPNGSADATEIYFAGSEPVPIE